MNVLVLHVRGLHLGYLGCYGNEWIETPALDRLAAAGVVFDQHYADRPDAEGAARAWRTGRYEFPFPGSDAGRSTDGPADVIRLLRENRITTCLIGGASQSATFRDDWDQTLAVRAAGKRHPLDRTLDATLKALDTLRLRASWLLWVEVDTLLNCCDIPAEFRERYVEEEVEAEEQPEQTVETSVGPAPGCLPAADDATVRRLQEAYAGAVSYVDAALGQVLDALDQRQLDQKPTLVVTTDRGLPLGEHGITDLARPWLHDELTHLPLIVRGPGTGESGLRVAALTQTVDLMPTLLELYGLPVPPVHGRSLVPLLRGQAEPVRAYAASGLQIEDGIEWALRTPQWAYLFPVQPRSYDPPRARQLYAKPEDRWEVNNLVQHHLDLAEYLEQVLTGFVAATRQPGPLQPPPLRDLEAELAQAKPTDEAGPPSDPPSKGSTDS
jgi:arylsulfatase A-like enzyme